MKTDSDVQKIILWRESLTLLPDEHFFNLVRMYLGEIKTPFNKQKVIESLSAFLRKEENQQNIICCLSEEDLKIISAVSFIKNCDYSKLEKMFSIEFSTINLYEKILNLQERLILFSYAQKETGKKIIDINPILEKKLKPYILLSNIVKQSSLKDFFKPEFFITTEFLILFLSYINLNPELCKNNLSFKKKTCSDLQGIFGTGIDISSFELLFKSFYNLLLIREKDGGFYIDWETMEKFSLLSERTRLILLSVAAAGHFSKTTIDSIGQELSDSLTFIASGAYEKNQFVMLSFLLKEFSPVSASPSRFSKLLARAENPDFVSDSIIFDSVVDCAVAFGIFAYKKSGDKTVIKISEQFLKCGTQEESACNNISNNNFININPGFSVSLMPGLLLRQGLLFSRVFCPVRYDTVSMLEITKKSVLKALETGLTLDLIFSEFKKYMSFEIPQNVKISMEEWAESFASISVYNGYVLKVNQENIHLVEKNPYIKKYISQKIAPGVYFLNCTSDIEFRECAASCGLEFPSGVTVPKKRNYADSFKEFSKTDKISIPHEEELERLPAAELEKKHKSLVQSLKKNLSLMNISPEQKEGLLERIDRSIVVNQEQLRPESVRFELLEAGGMDFTGKIHIIEAAIKERSLLQIELNGNDAYIIGLPFNLEKQGSDSALDIYLEPGKEEYRIKVASAARIKKLHGTALAFN